ncbi:tandem-95 repeat protein [Pedobacter polaris]|uniref:Tandem-95 repeat protein n=1 Tax=Pedobacter polaris TaxID=2571273 RepID=A0A4U1CSP0_9SPHI|nr:Ig-like domain-containing protein [Pedobacter polaris]TKC10546.1 tandem-95 repeat protein [Pedobacter polaris]
MKLFYKRILLLFIILIGMIFATPVFAEGSKDFYPSGVSGNRAFLVSTTTYPGGFISANSYPFLTEGAHYAYVKNGETIAAASSAQNVSNGRIRLTAPDGTVYTSTNTDIGRIYNHAVNVPAAGLAAMATNRASELAGSRIGYAPFERVASAAQEGVWKIEFISPSAGVSTSPVTIDADANWAQATNASVSAWDVSVFANAVTTTPVTGRIYSNVLNLMLPQTWNAGEGFYGKHYVLTKDGYAYLVNENGLNGAAYTFFVNSKGFTSAAGGAGSPTYKSLNSSTVNVFVKDPRTADNANGITHKIFYNKPDDTNLPATATFADGGTTWLKPASVVVPTVTNIVFEGVENSGSNVSSKGANIKFDSNVNGTYKILIPGGGNFIDRVLTGTTVAGNNTVVWDGAAGLSVADPVSPGIKVPPGTVLNQVKVQLFGAEVHFPFIDVEINPNGLIIEQLTTDGAYNLVAGGDIVYWDDSNVSNAGTPPNPKKAVLGISNISSNANGHKWGANPGAGAGDYGNEKSLDTYTFVPGAEITKVIAVTIAQADLEVTSITPSVTNQTVGNTVTYTVVIKNLNTAGVSVSDVTGATFGLEYPTGFTVNSAVLTVNTGTIVESSPTTTATKFSSTLSMTSGSQATYVITGTIGAALKNTTLTPRATILRPADIADPNATDESTPTFSGNVDTECDGNPSGVGCNNIKSPTGVTIPNSPPVGVPNVSSTNMNTTLTVADGATGTGGDLLVNDTDADGDALVVTKFTVAGSAGDKTLGGAGFLIPGQGTITINANGSYSFVPVTNFTGAVNTITYTLSDGTATTTTTLNITVNATNSAPTGVANTNTVAEDVTLTVADGATGVTGDLLVNDTDPENDVLTITSYTIAGIVGTQTVATPVLIPAVGTITINANGSYTFVPVANYNGTVPQITYTATDGTATATSTLDITVTPVNDAPVLTANTNTVAEDVTLTVTDGATGVTGDILVNDSDVDGNTLTVASYTIFGVVGTETVGTPVVITNVGTITINANGSYTFVPALNYNGNVPQITYTATDGTATATSTLDITVTPVNDAPVAVNNTGNTNEDVTLTVTDGATGVTGDILVNDTDVEGNTLTVASYTIAGIIGTQTVGTPVVITNVSTITINVDGSYTFVPAANYNGAVPVMTYTVTDGTATATATLTITINPINDTPVLAANTNTVAEDVTLTVADGATGVTGDILVNDTDVDGNTLTVASYTIAGIVGTQTVATPVLIPAVGTITINANGSYTFVPVANYNGTVPQITYTATDGTATATSTLDITVTPVNDVPVLTANTNTVAEDITLTVVDGDAGVTGDILVNDSDIDGNTLTVASYTIAGIVGTQTVATPVLIPAVGTITINANGSYTFVPVANYNGTVPQITYTATDGTATATSTLDITVTPVNDAPVAVANTGNTNEDVTLTVADGATGVTGDILVNDTDIDGNTLTVASYTIAGIVGTQIVGTPVVIANVGTITINANGAYTFVPAANYDGAVPVITYTATDGTATATSTLTITINPINDAPIAVANTNTTLEDTNLTVADGATGVTGDILVNDTDAEGNTLTVTDYSIAGIAGTQTVGTPVIITGVGTITINANGSYAFQPVANYNGAVPSITYNITDGNGGTATSTLAIAITPVNDIPSFTKGADQVIAINSPAQTVTPWATTISSGPANESSQTLNFVVTNDKNGLFTTQPAISSTGVLTYTPAAGQYGKTTVTVYIQDNGGTANGGVDQSATQTFVISVKPVGVTDTDITPINTATTTVVTANDGPSGIGTTVIPGGTNPTNGSITINPDKSITYTPNNGYVGNDTYTYILETPDGVKSDPITVNITVYDPKITLAKEGIYNDFNANGKVDAGDRINYTFVVTNTGTVPVTNITISDPAATITGGPIVSLAVAGVDNSTFTGFHTLTQAEIDNGGVFNLATATGKDPKNNNVTTTSNDPTPLSPTDPNYPVTPPTPACPTCTVTPILQTGAMTLAKDGSYNDFNANGKVDAGDRINYTFVVTNTGNVTLTNVTITDANATITGGPIASLAVGASNNNTFTGYHVLTQADIDNSGVYNLATAKAKDPKGKDITTTSNDPTPLDPTDPNYPVTPPTPACPTCTITPIVQTGSMSLAKDGSYNDFNANGKVDAGDRINYTFVVTNTGNVTLTNVTITDANATITGGPIASLAVGASNNNTFTGFHTLTQSEIDNGGVYNLATATGKDPKDKTITTTSNDPTPLDPTDPNYPVTPPTPACPTCTITPIVQTPSLALIKDGSYNDFNANGKVDAGDRINYTFVVTNTGNVTLTNVMVTDPSATITGGPIVSLASGAVNSNTFIGYHVLTQAEIDNGGVFNLATATGKDPKNNNVTTTSNDPTPLSPTDPNYPVTPPTPACPTCTVTPIVQTGAMTLAKDGSYNDFNANGKVDAGDRINYTFVVTNTGNVTLTNVTITDANATITGGPIASLAVGASNNNTFTGFHTLTQSEIDNGGVYNLATATGKDPKDKTITTTSNDPTPLDPTDPNYPVTPPTPACPTCTITPIVQTGALTLAKDGSYNDFNANGKVDAGDRINYTFVVTNTGNVTLTNVMVTDPAATITGGPIASLAVGASNNNTFTGFHTLTQSEIDNGGVYNLATATGKDPKDKTITTTSNDPTPLDPTDPNYPVTPPTPACPTCTITPIVQTGSMSLTKEGVYSDVNGDGKVNVGDRINYTFVVTNTGNVTLTNVMVTDPAATITGGPIASLVVGAVDNSTFTGYHVLTQADIDNSGVYNLATATGKDPKDKTITTTSNDPTPLDPTDPNYPVTPPTPACPTCTITPIVQTGAMTLAKDGSYNDFNANGKVDAGDRINYTFVVTNTGNVTLTNVMVTDPAATITGGPIASLAVGAIDNSTFTGYHVLTQADIDNSGVYNLATATGKDPKDKTITTTSNDPTPLDPTDPNYPVTPPTPACPTCTITPIVQTGSMSLAKEGVYSDANGDGKVNVGDRINYTFVVTNTGNTTLTNVMVTDPAATITGGPIASLAVGAVDNSTFTGYHVLTQADIDNSGVYNLATAKAKDPKGKDITTTSNDPTPLDPTDPNYPVTPPTPACPTCTITPIVQTGAMTLAKDGSYNDFNANGKVDAGDRINYTFVVTNTGNVTLTNVNVSDVNAIITGGPIATLAVGATDNTTFTGYHVLTAAELDNGGVFNTATATGKDPKDKTITTTSNDPTPLDPTDPNYPVTPPTPACPTCTVTPIVQTGSMSLAKEGVYNDFNADGRVNVGDRINYTFVVTNTGNTTLTNITVTDPSAVITGGPLATLAAGASNNSTFTAYHILTQADIDNGGVFNVATAKGKDPRGKDITTTSIDPTPLNPTDPNYPVTPPTPACPTCTVTPVPQIGSMSIAKEGTYSDTNGDGKVNIGDRINYTFVVANTGNVTLTNITVTDANAVVNGGPLTTLAVGASNNTTFTAYHILTQADMDNGGVFNSAVAKGKDPKNKDITTTSNDPTPLNPTDPNYPITPPIPVCPTCTVTPIVQTGSMTLLKDGVYNDTNGDGKVNVGDRINYTFRVTNTGNVTLTNITIADANATINGGPLASLAVGASNSTTFTGYHVLTQGDIDNKGVFNTATATGKDPRNQTITVNSTDPTPVVPGAPEYPINPPTPACPTCTVTPIVQIGSIALVKTVTNTGTGAGGNFVLGDAIQYTFTITNTGNVTLSGITLTDVKLGTGTIAIPGTLAPNATATIVRTYTVIASDIAAGNVTNTAVVNAKDPANNPITDVSGSTTTNNTPTVTSLAKPPVANNDAATTRQNDPVTVTVVTNDVPGSTPIAPATVVITVQPAHGTVKVNADGTVTYTPNPGYVGTDTFTYTVKDANGQTSNPAVVNLTVVPSNPKATNDAAKTTFNTPVTIPVILNDVKDGADFDPATIEIIGQPQHGTIKINADGTITYTPKDGYTGTETFTYRVKDKYGNWTNAATVTVLVEGTFIPNVITPDGDGKNDYFVIVGLPNYDRVEVEFYNRWGNQVYINNNYKNDWNGERLNEGTYYYTIRLRKGNTVSVQKGWVLIKR